MKSSTTYHSPLRQAQSAATSQRILEAVREVLERGDEPTYALVAEAAGCQERTVYRHFPTREHLAAAFWDWQYSILGPRDWTAQHRSGAARPHRTGRSAPSTSTRS